MAELTKFGSISDFGREQVQTEFEFIGENKTPLYDHFMAKSKPYIDEQGKRIPIETQRPGGHTSFGRANVDFRAPVSMEGDSMRAFPVWYALPFKIDGSSIRSMKKGNKDQFLKYGRYMTSLTRAAKKRLNFYCHGDGTAVLGILNDTSANSTGSRTWTMSLLASSAAGEGGTKGGVRLEDNHVYALIDTDGVTLNQIFTVTTPSRTTPTVNVTTSNAAGAAGDMIVDLGPTNTTSAYKKAPQGLRGLANNSGIIQNASRTTHPNLKTPRYNGGDLPITPVVINNMKALVNIAANDMGEATGRLVVSTPGQDAILRAQQYGFRRTKGNETVRGVATKYVDQDGDTNLFDADGAEDRLYVLDDSSYSWHEEKPFGMYNEDSLDIRMLHGANNSGSDAFFGAIGCGGQLVKLGLPRCDAYCDRLSQTGVQMQQSL